MRVDIDEEKKKYVQLVEEKNEILKHAKIINDFAISMITKSNPNA